MTPIATHMNGHDDDIAWLSILGDDSFDVINGGGGEISQIIHTWGKENVPA